jgi:hypothetical protein
MTRIISIVGGLQPSTPTIGTATAGDTTASVAFTPSTYIGKGTITYTATSSPSGLTGTGSSSPITVSGLTNGTAYTFTVTGTTNYGVTSLASAASNSVTPAVVLTGSYDALASYTVPSGGTSAITFAGLPTSGQYSHLQIRGISRTNRATYNTDNFTMRINSDSGSNYSWHQLNSPPNTATSTVGVAGYSNQTFMYGFSTATSVETGIFGGAVIDILDYASTSKYKTVRALTGADTNGQASGYTGYVSFTSGFWMNTSAINSITLYPDYGTNFLEYTQFSIYGVK